MALNIDTWADNLGNHQAWYERATAGWARWLRAGGRLGEWADNTLPDIQFAGYVLRLNERDTVINLSCGWGRHAITLAHYGLNVIGLDASSSLLELARETSAQAGLKVRWVHGELSDVALTSPVDCVAQFHNNLLEWAKGPADALFLLDQVHAVLKTGGRFLFGDPAWLAIPPRHEQSEAETPEGTESYHNYFDPRSRTFQSQIIVTGRDGEQHEYWRYTWRPTVEQMAALLHQAGFNIAGQFNNYSFSPYNPDQPGLVWSAEKK